MLKNTWDDMEDSRMYQLYWDSIHKLDFVNYDVVILCYGTNDYIKAHPIQVQSEYAESKYGEVAKNNEVIFLDNYYGLDFNYMKLGVIQMKEAESF